MFESFFPKPKIFFPSVLAWAAVGIFIWYIFGDAARAELSEHSVPIAQVSKLIAQEWENLSEDAKAPYEAQAIEDRARYESEMEA